MKLDFSRLILNRLNPLKVRVVFGVNIALTSSFSIRLKVCLSTVVDKFASVTW